MDANLQLDYRLTQTYKSKKVKFGVTKFELTVASKILREAFGIFSKSISRGQHDQNPRKLN